MKVKVRIAVAVGSDGSWNSCGWSESANDSEVMDLACDPMEHGFRRYWIEAELDVPEVTTAQGKTTPA